MNLERENFYKKNASAPLFSPLLISHRFFDFFLLNGYTRKNLDKTWSMFPNRNASEGSRFVRANGACVRNVQGKLHDAPLDRPPHIPWRSPGEFRRSPGQPVPNDYPLKSWSREQLCGGARVNSIIALYSVPRVIATFPRMQIPLRRGTTETYHRWLNTTMPHLTILLSRSLKSRWLHSN